MAAGKSVPACQCATIFQCDIALGDFLFSLPLARFYTVRVLSGEIVHGTSFCNTPGSAFQLADPISILVLLTRGNDRGDIRLVLIIWYRCFTIFYWLSALFINSMIIFTL